MGCCLSTNAASLPSKRPNGIVSNSPPHPLLEEETVKEVLTETPAVHKRPLTFEEKRQTESVFIKNAPLLQDDYSRRRNRNGAVLKNFTDFGGGGGGDSEEVSEICSSISESVSASAAERSDEMRRRSPARMKNRSLSGDMKREKTVGRSPDKRSEPSPNRVGRGSGSGLGSSGRRSRSPMTRLDLTPSRTSLGRSQSARKTGKSPGLGQRVRKVDDESVGRKFGPTSNELLENPLVSLECFIFL